MALRIISEKSRNHSIFLCSRLSEIFELQTYGRCHATIKTFNSENRTVTTRARDSLSHNISREIVDEHLIAYKYTENTAFQNIIDDPNLDCYINNHLRISHFLGKYNNSNNEWRKHYRATIVMPITTSRNPAHITADSVIGFVCVDNMCGNFNDRYSKALLGMFVVLITDMMLKLGEMESSPPGGGNHG
jgi:hypothetical protein